MPEMLVNDVRSDAPTQRPVVLVHEPVGERRPLVFRCTISHRTIVPQAASREGGSRRSGRIRPDALSELLNCARERDSVPTRRNGGLHLSCNDAGGGCSLAA